MSPANGDCTFTPPILNYQQTLQPSVATVLPQQTWTVLCKQGGIEKDDDGDGLVDEDPSPFPGSDSPFYVVNILLQDQISQPKDGHVTDPDITNNVVNAVVSLAVIRPFTPSFASYMTASSTDVTTSPAPDTTCIQGMPCKTEAIAAVPASMAISPGWTADGQPLMGIATVVGEAPGVFAWTAGPGLPNGVTVGSATANVHVTPVSGVVACNVPVAVGPITLYDACLPPPGYLGITGFVPEAGCAVDVPTGPVALAPPAAFTSWSSSLDGEVALVQGGQPTAYLWAHYSAVAIVAGSPVPANVLIFDLSGGLGFGPWLSWFSIADPGAPPTPFGIGFCSPYQVDPILLGKTSVAQGGLTIKSCTALGTHFVIGNLTRQDLGETDQTFVPYTCLPPATDITCDLVRTRRRKWASRFLTCRRRTSTWSSPTVPARTTSPSTCPC
jgi:hypothetical protein